MKQTIAFTLYAVLAVLIIISFAPTVSAASDTAPKTQESDTADATEMRFTIDVEDRYTGGLHSDNAGSSSAGKTVFIGVGCVIILTGIIIIAVKSRGDSDGVEENEASASPENGGEKEGD